MNKQQIKQYIENLECNVKSIHGKTLLSKRQYITKPESLPILKELKKEGLNIEIVRVDHEEKDNKIIKLKEPKYYFRKIIKL